MAIELNNGQLCVRLVPEVGGSIIECSLQHEGQWVSIMRDGEDPLMKSSNASSFVLIPYSNRLRDGHFTFEGKNYQLRQGEKHAIHGDVRDRPWMVEAQGRNGARLHFDSSGFPDLNFPFPFKASLSYQLESSTFVSKIEITNTGQQTMPAGCGFHPYFFRRLPGSTSDVTLQFGVKGVYPGDSPLPTGMAIPISAHQDFSRPRCLDVELDHCFFGWNRQAMLSWPGTGIHAWMNADPGMEHIILYSPGGQPYFALEPVTHANDGFNLYAKGERNCGVVILRPGDRLTAGMQLVFQTHHANGTFPKPISV